MSHEASSFPCTGMELLLLRKKERSSHLSPFLFFPPSPPGIWEERRKEEGVMARLPFLPSLQFGKTSRPLFPPVPKKMCLAMGGERGRKRLLWDHWVSARLLCFERQAAKSYWLHFSLLSTSLSFWHWQSALPLPLPLPPSCFPGCLSSYFAGCDIEIANSVIETSASQWQDIAIYQKALCFEKEANSLSLATLELRTSPFPPLFAKPAQPYAPMGTADCMAQVERKRWVLGGTEREDGGRGRGRGGMNAWLAKPAAHSLRPTTPLTFPPTHSLSKQRRQMRESPKKKKFASFLRARYK